MVSKAESEAQEETGLVEWKACWHGLEVTTEGVRTGTGKDGEIVGESSRFKRYDAKAARAK